MIHGLPSVQYAYDSSGNLLGQQSPLGLLPAWWKRAARSIMWLGDSITMRAGQCGSISTNAATAHAAHKGISPTYTNLNGAGLFVIATEVHGICPTGAGTLRFYVADSTMTWQANGDIEGARVTITNCGFYSLETGTVGTPITLALIVRFKPAADKSDSITVPTTSARVRNNASSCSFPGWSQMLLDNPFNASFNFGISTIKASEWLTAKSQWQGIYTDLTFIFLGTNDVVDLTSAAQAIADVTSIVKLRQSIGSTPIVMTLLPNGTRSTAASQAAMHFNLGIREMGEALNVDIADPWAWLASPEGTGAWASGMSASDTIHPNAKANYLMAAKTCVPILKKYTAPADPRVFAGLVFHATNAPHGNLATNGVLVGTAGTAGAGLTGHVPTSWNAFRGVGSVLTSVSTAPDDVSPIARVDGKQGFYWRNVVTNTGGVDGETLQIRLAAFMASGNFSVGDLIVLEGDLRLSGTGIQFLQVEAGANSPGRYTEAIMYDNTSGFQLSDLAGDTVTLPFRSAPLRIETGDSNFQINFILGMLANGVATLDIGQTICLHKVSA